VTNSIESVHILGSLQVRPEDLTVRHDVVSLFTRVTIVELLNLLSQHISGDILVLFTHVLTPTYFSVGDQFYEQTDGVAMGSPLSPVITNFFMEDFEDTALAQATHKPLCWSAMLMTHVIWLHKTKKLERLLNHLTGLQRNIQFTVETERHGHPPVLDINIYGRPDGSLGH